MKICGCFVYFFQYIHSSVSTTLSNYTQQTYSHTNACSIFEVFICHLLILIKCMLSRSVYAHRFHSILCEIFHIYSIDNLISNIVGPWLITQFDYVHLLNVFIFRQYFVFLQRIEIDEPHFNSLFAVSFFFLSNHLDATRACIQANYYW